jgi:hypothetical protein
MDNPGFELLREAFKQFASKHDAADLTGRVVRSVAAGGKAAVDQAMQEFPQNFLKEMVNDFYNMVASQEVADGVSMTVSSYDEEKVKGLLDDVVAQLKTDEVAQKVAKSVKDALSKASNSDLEDQIDLVMNGRSAAERIVFKMFFEQAKPILDEMRNASEEEVAEKIKELADTIPTDTIAAQVGSITREVTPERVAKQTHDFVGKLPSPATISEMVHEIGASASEKFGRVAKGGTLADAQDALREFIGDAARIAQDAAANDQNKKKTFKRGGQDFDL